MKVKTLKELYNMPEGTELVLNEDTMYFEYEFNKEEDNYIGWSKVKLPYEAVINQLERPIDLNAPHVEFLFRQVIEVSELPESQIESATILDIKYLKGLIDELQDDISDLEDEINYLKHKVLPKNMKDIRKVF
jgi:hypothetical protein